MLLEIRKAQLVDVPEIRRLINEYAELELMLFRSLTDLYGSIRDFFVGVDGERIVGCCALAIIWSDLGELRSLAVSKEFQGKGIGRALVVSVLQEAKQLGLSQVFTLTLEKGFFEHLGFKEVSMDSLPMKVWSDCVRCPKQANCDEIALVYPCL